MKKIHFEFFDEEKVYYDTDLNYTKEDEYIVFTLDNVIYKVKLDDNIEFRRITLEEEFLLRDNECLVTLTGVEGICIRKWHRQEENDKIYIMTIIMLT